VSSTKSEDLEQPVVFDVHFARKSLRLEFFDTSSPVPFTQLRPSVIVLCYSIIDRKSLSSVHTVWKEVVESHFNYDENIPVIMLGLKRDLRREKDPTSIFAQEAIGIAQQMRCDKYCECSSFTGELCKEVFEDIVKTAAMTTTESGGKSEPPACSLM